MLVVVVVTVSVIKLVDHSVVVVINVEVWSITSVMVVGTG